MKNVSKTRFIPAIFFRAIPATSILYLISIPESLYFDLSVSHAVIYFFSIAIVSFIFDDGYQRSYSV